MGDELELRNLLSEFFATVSFDRTVPIYERLPALFISRGILIRNGGDEPVVYTVPEFIADRQRAVDNGELTSFYEAEVSGTTHFFGRIGHRFSVYEKRGVRRSESFDGRGVISTQFVAEHGAWKIVSMAWDDERK